MIYRIHFKPAGDFLISMLLIVLLSPIIICSIILLFIANNGHVFFIQERPGYKTIPFKIIKFKTMREAFDDKGNPLPDDIRLTFIGRIVRSWSIDELLQLLNVLNGDMSLVGPRPLLMRYLPRYSPEQAIRHDVKPGITGLAQVNGRNSISWDEKFDLDIKYVKNQSFKLDILILVKTVINVFTRKDINSNQNTTMEEFLGITVKPNL